LQTFRRKCADYGRIVLKIGLICALAANFPGCDPASETVEVEIPVVAPTNECGAQGYLSAELYGAIEASVNWTAPDLHCEGMKRPSNRGARLRFSGHASDGKNLAFIISVPDLQLGETGEEYRSNITLIEEGGGRFFATADLEICWTDIDGVESVDDTSTRFAISGAVYCVAPLREVNGDSDVSIRDFRFRGLLDWDAS